MSKVILVVDDEDDIASTLELALSMEGYQVRLAYQGREALEMLSIGPLPHLIISDIMMPVMDGYELAREIKKNPKLKDIPLIMTSAGRMDVDRLPNNYTFLRKPFSLDELFSVVGKALSDK